MTHHGARFVNDTRRRIRLMNPNTQFSFLTAERNPTDPAGVDVETTEVDQDFAPEALGCLRGT